MICHHDDFFAGLDEPFGFAPNVRVASVPDEVAAVGADVVVAALPRIGPV